MAGKPTYEELEQRVSSLESAEWRLKAAEHELRQSRATLKAFLDHSPAGLCILDQELRYIYVNKVLQKMNGRSREEHVGHTIQEVLPERAQSLIPRFRQVMDRGKAILNIELTGEASGNSNRSRSYLISCFPIGRDVPDGPRIGCIVLDVTETRKAETERKNSEIFLEKLMNAIPVPVFYKDREGRYLGFNDAFETFFGENRDTLIGKSAFDISPSDLARVYRAKDEELFERGGVQRYESQVRNAHGRLRDVLFSKAVFTDDRNKPIGLIGAVLDITERKRAEEALQRQSAVLEERVGEKTRQLEETQEQLIRKEKLAALGQLAGGVGHELRNPLGAIKNAVYFLRMALENPENEIRDTLGILDREVSLCEKTIQALFDYADPKGPSLHAGVNLNEKIRAALAQIPLPSTVEVREDLREHVPPMECDPDKMEQVIRNLLLNAIQAMPEGGRLTVWTRRVEPDQVEFGVSDTGVGIGEEKRARVFEPLFTTKAKGIGLGLALCRSHVEAHGGGIRLKSEEGEGTTFTVTLPVRAPDAG